MDFKKIVLVLFLAICLIGAVNATKNVDDFILPSGYYPLSEDIPLAHEGTFSHKGGDQGLVIMEYGQDDDDIAMYLAPTSDISFTENEDDTLYFVDDSSYSHGVYEVFEVDGEKFLANFWFSNSNDISDDEIYDVVSKFNEDNSVSPIDFSNTMIVESSFTTENTSDSKTNCKAYVGQLNRGRDLKISVKYSRGGEELNEGKIVPVTVDEDGYVSVDSADAFDKFPDKAIVTIYDSDENVLDKRTYTLKIQSGTQTY